MNKKRFRIIKYNKGDNSFYETKVKTWFGWISFAVYYKTDIIHVLSDPSAKKALAYERIYQYCQEKGYNQKDIVITEVDDSKSKKWVFFQRAYSD